MNKLTKFLTKWSEEIFVIIWCILLFFDAGHHDWVAAGVDFCLILIGVVIIVNKHKDTPQ